MVKDMHVEVKQVVNKVPALYRNFCFTINNWTQQDWDKMVEFANEYCKYLVMGKEVAPTTGTPHLQGYCEFKPNVRKSLRTIRKVTAEKIANIEPRYGQLPKETSGYCKKGSCDIKPPNGWIQFFDNPDPTWDGYEYGEISKPGERSDLEEATNSILKGEASVDDICVENPIMHHMYGRTLDRIEAIAMRKKYRTKMTTCDWYVGKTGVGKSQIAYRNYDPETTYTWKKEKTWQDGYCHTDTNQSILIILNMVFDVVVR